MGAVEGADEIVTDMAAHADTQPDSDEVRRDLGTVDGADEVRTNLVTDSGTQSGSDEVRCDVCAVDDELRPRRAP